jgi:hypothetical protein
MHLYLQRTREAIEEATRGMTPEQLAWHLQGKWSAAEILEHLSLAFSSTSKALDRVLSDGRPSAGSPTFYERVVTTLVVDIGYFPSGRQAPEYTRPRGATAETILPAIGEKLEEMDGKISECERRFGAGRIARHPIIGPFTARQWRRFHWIHTRHHMKQVARLRQMQASGAKS